MKNDPAKNGVPNHLLGVEHDTAQGRAPTFESFREELGTEGFDKAIAVYAKFKAQDSEWKLGDDVIDNWGDELVGEAHYTEAIEVAKLGLSVYPEYGDYTNILADAYDKVGQKDMASCDL